MGGVDGGAKMTKSVCNTILVVDDCQEVLTLVSAFLRNEDYQVLTATSGSEGLQKSRKFEGEISLLVSDVEMPPGMTGFELAATITFERPTLKVLLMSGYTRELLTLNEGWHFLEKPFPPQELKSLVASLIPHLDNSRSMADGREG